MMLLRKFTRWLGWLLFSIMLVSCAPVMVLPASTGIPEITFTPTTEVVIIVSTNTPPSPTATPAPDNTPTPPSIEELVPTIEVIPICPGKGELVSTPAALFISGTILYQTYYREDLSLLTGNGSTSTALIPPTQKAVGFGFSPDGEWLAYAPLSFKDRGDEIRADTLPLVLLSSSGESIERTVDLKTIENQYSGNLALIVDRSEGSYWINERLISLVLVFDHFNDGDSYDIRFKILDPFEPAWREEPLKQLTNRFVTDFYDGTVAFSPDMSSVLYEARAGEFTSGLALRDLERNEVLWADPEFEYDAGITLMQWSPDGSMVAAANRGKVNVEDTRVIVISREGQARVIADPTLFSDNFVNNYLAWAPDNQHLAFFVDHRNLDRSGLYIYDAHEEHYLYVCPLNAYREYPPTLVWSPDSMYIALSAKVPGYPVQILNVETGEVYELLDSTKNALVLGWSDKFTSNLP
jgi:WD40 repeat protein